MAMLSAGPLEEHATMQPRCLMLLMQEDGR